MAVGGATVKRRATSAEADDDGPRPSYNSRMRLHRTLPLVLLLFAPTRAATPTRYVVGHDYEYGGGSVGDMPNWRAITWVWRSEADREACRRSIFEDPNVRRSDPLGTTACEHARLPPVRHRSAVDVQPADPSCGALTTITFRPAGQDVLTLLTGCIVPAQLDEHQERLERGAWVFAVDVHQLAGGVAPDLRRIGAYPTWTECERIRLTVRDDLAKETDAEAADGSKLAGTGACLPDELLE